MIEEQLAALAVDTRRQIYAMLVERPRSVRELADELPVTRPAVSQHLKVLMDAGLARSADLGARRIYSADPAGVAAFRRWADQLWSEAVGTFADFANSQNEEEVMSETNIMIEPVVKTVTLSVSPEVAFDLFTEQMTSWWPLDSHSVGEARARSVRFEPVVGGRIVETTDDGVEHAWGIVTAWDAGERVAFTWFPGLPQDQQTVVDVRFRKKAGATEMLLVHSGWEARGNDGPTVRENYNSGWDYVLGKYREVV